MNNTTVNVVDEYVIWEKLKKLSNYGPCGWVVAIKDKEILIDEPNLIVGIGREFIAQKIIGSNLTETGYTVDNYQDHQITHFSVGSGGADTSNNVSTILGPNMKDRNIYQPISLGNEQYLDDPSNFIDSVNPELFNYMNSVKPITKKFLEPIRYDESGSYNAKIKYTCNVPPGEPAGLSPGFSVPINEAGLYFTNGSNVNLFSHICFSTKGKELESNFTIYWYILC